MPQAIASLASGWTLLVPCTSLPNTPVGMTSSYLERGKS